MENIIEVKNLKRVYTTKVKKTRQVINALNGISFNVKKGDIFGLLGPNGAGKSTTIKILTTMLSPTEGEVSILGLDIEKGVKEIRRNINFVFGGERGVYGQLTAKEYLNYFALLYKLPRDEKKERIQYLLGLVGLTDNKDQKIHTFSKGMKQRLHIARSLINRPQIIFLDEPTIGLDPPVANKIKGIIKYLSQKGVTIILTTHYMKEAEDLCTNLAFINKGEITLSGSPLEIKERYEHLDIYEATYKLKENKSASSDLFSNTSIVNIDNDIYMIRFEVEKHTSIQDIQAEFSVFSKLLDIERKSITLEDIFINFVGSE
ncbi:ABC transporter ATP-binding protein [Bacillus fungorum]|uniref:ABC transporter ATP-binding protein n=1 Tax=Bacillus fungorum TaxID=2039284 RepID=UPI003398A61F